MKRQQLFVLVVAASLASACGPSIRLNASLKQAGADIFFGRPAASPAPIPLQQPPLPSFPAPIEIPPLSFYPPPVKIGCPSASPLAAPPLEASTTAAAPPAPATYEFRYDGTDVSDPGAADQKTVRLHGVGTRQVANVVPLQPDGHYGFDVVETFNGRVETNTYVVYPQSRAAAVLPNAAGSPDAGIYLSAMKIQPAGQTAPTQSFRPATPIELLAFPVQVGPETLAADGSDAFTTMQIDPNESNPNSSVIRGRVRLNACGMVVQGWQDMLAGKIVTTAGPGPNETFSLELDFGTQYGGISLSDHLALDDTGADGKPEHYEVTAIIDQSPKVPK